MADQLIRFIVMRDPHFDSLQFRPAEHAAKLQKIATLLDATSSDLDAFRDRGGKLLLMHGTVDMAISPYASIAYYEQLRRRYGAGLSNFVLFFLAPGFGHGDGPFQVSWDSISALDDWVEHNRIPTNQIVTDTAPPTAGRSRPLCEYPNWPQFIAGDPNAASSFRCVPGTSETP